ncbi:hypothetical protein AK830_g7786 [Neonectria ditissima]|uniref:Uncharacterized protein n=1 Tax=Neonectria ditissima TaxID=78410 RepID=A0A0P7BD07_9HYPO|nr:hypothetical protein AK830_g7786 [Neonectria ditissima]
MEPLRSLQPLTKATANPNAATAAASAFMRREPSTSLSSAAAAAALRARPTTPTNVAQVQSKRVARRSASVSSAGSRDRGGRELHRAPSTGSMSDRTFRSPSPGRGPPPRSHDVPPVPSLPNDEQYKTESTNRPHKRATSLQIQPFRTASQKMQDGQGSSWFGAAAAGDMSNIRHSDALFEPRHSSDLRPSSPSSSINFSYPRSGSLESDRTMVYDANSRRMVPRVEILIREQNIRDASEKPTKKKRQPATQSGSYLKKGNVSRLKGTAVEAPVPPSTAPKAPQVSHNKPSVQKTQRAEPKQYSKPEPPVKKQAVVESESEPESDFEEPPNYEREVVSKASFLPPDNRSRSSPVKKKRPSVVHELSEPEDEYEYKQEARASTQSQDTLVSDEVLVKPSPPIQTEPETTTVEPEPQQPKAQAVVENRIESTPRARVHSESPARTPRFAAKTDQLLVIHEPPPRSLSPRKSAMKHRSPTRDASPSEDGSDASNALMSASSQDDPATARRKSVRVSFDDQNTFVVGESAEPAEPDLAQLPSPQSKKAWHNIINRPKRDSWTLDEDEKMTPRPALPFFGSVREKKPKDSEERPLVRPTERAWSPQTTAVSSRQASPDQTSPPDPGQSSDLAIGSILAQEQSSRNAANISKYREPLPPVVTSVDSPGYISNSPSSSDDEMELPAKEHPGLRDDDDLPNHQNLTTELGSDESIPMISISHPSPRVQDDDQPDSPQDFFDLPGGFPDDGSSKSEESRTPPNEVVEKSTTELETGRSARTSISHRPPPLTPQRSMDPAVGSPPSPQIHDIQEEEGSDGSSIYSDAYEDLSDIEGDGFMSLDAIVDSPVNKVSKKLFEKTVAKSKENDAAKNMPPTDPTKREPLQTQDDWEHAKAYWKSLSTDKRRQLEQEAAEEAGEEADLEEAAPQPKKAKKRKSLEQRREQVVAEEPHNPERVYQIQPGTSWNESEASESPVSVKAKSSGGSKLRKSMRGEESKPLEQSRSIPSGGMRMSMRSGGAPVTTSNDGHMRKSLRAEPEQAPVAGTTRMQKSMRSNGPVDATATSRSSQKKRDRPVSYQPATTEPVQNPRRNQSADRATSSATLPANSATKPGLRRRGSDSSESSFRRSRPGAGESFGFNKRTMRGSAREPAPASPAAPASDAGKSSSRFSLRSLSPTGSAFRRNSGTVSPPPVVMGGRIRQSLRGESSDRSTSSLRVSGFGRSSNKKAKKGRSNSRFADSSDEEDARPSTRSRFADSSDEEGAPLPKLKGNGVPKTMRSKPSGSAAATATSVPQSQKEDEDSPDLPDSDDEIEQPQSVVTSSNVTASKKGTTLSRSGSGRDSLRPATATQPANTQASGSPRPGHARRGSFMSILRRKKDGGGKVSRPVSESAARRDTRLERSTEELAVIRSTSGQHNARLQKRSPNWPLPEDADANPQDDGYGEDESHDTYVNEEKRPSTASGAPLTTSSTSKPGFIKRRSTSQGALGLNHNGADTNGPLSEHNDGSHDQPESQKKKKFGSLRKIFGLHD